MCGVNVPVFSMCWEDIETIYADTQTQRKRESERESNEKEMI